MAIFAPFITWHPPLKTLVGNPFTVPNNHYPFGTDDLGRDIYSNVIYGLRTSLIVGLSSVAIAVAIGTLIGVLAGYYRGLLEDLLMRITDMTLILPQFLLALIIVAIFGQNFQNIILAIGVVSWPGIARMIRAEFLSIRERPFVEAAKAIGLSDTKIIFSEILPNAIPAVIPYVILQVNAAILIEAGLGFLGIADPNVPSLGLMLNTAQQYLMSAWWMAVFPGIMLSFIVIGLNLLGDGLVEYLNPRLRKK
ncbi:MAG: ABC transporter permease [Nitrososphaeria archaeon]|nr:ABC transporter permease [Nitrososphaeria archaeon]MDW7986240.1 ABC transporter permease [Nitrososphaerota archaeon]